MRLARAKAPGRFQAAILRVLGWHPDFVPYGDEGGMSAAGIGVNEERLLSLSAAWACGRLISETIATLPLSMYEKTGSGKRVATQHPLHFIIHDQPNPDSTAAVHWEATIAAMLFRGNARAERLEVGGRLVGLRFLNPSRLDVSCDANGRRVYRYREGGGRQREIPASKIWNIPGFSLDGREGVSVIKYGAQVFGAAIAADRAASNTFKNGLHPTVAFKFPGVLRPDQRDEAKETIRKLSGSVHAGNPIVLESDMGVEQIGINPNDAQLLESRAFSVEEVCRWFRVPPFMVGHAEKSTSWGTGIEQQMIGFLTFTLGPWLKRIEQAISKDLLTPAERARYYPKFNVEGLLRSDSAARAAFYSAMVNNGIYTRDEVRELEDREPMGGNAAVLTVQTALAPLDNLGQVDDAGQARAALMSWLREPEPPAQG